MISHLYSDDSPAARMLDLIARHAPRLMRCGGGSLPREQMDHVTRARTSPELVACIVALGREGRLNVTQIAREVSSTQSVAFKILARHGLRAPDGRAGRISKRRVNA